MTGKLLLKALKKACDTRAVFRFPYVTLLCTSAEFAEKDDSDREVLIAKKLEIAINELRSTLHNNLFSMRLLTPEELERDFPDSLQKNRGEHWLSAFVSEEMSGYRTSPRPVAKCKTVHFYGYKGGQARSTLLASISSIMARDGWKVLSVDCDVEAPSLDVIYRRKTKTLSSTLLGISQHSPQITPERVVTPSTGEGYVDFIACRPNDAAFDLDAAAFALRVAMDPSVMEDAANQIAALAGRNKYDVVLFDHRSGAASTPLPVMMTLPGPVVVCVRLDEQWRAAESHIRTVLRCNPENPGVFVSFKTDEENVESFCLRNKVQTDDLLNLLAHIVGESGEPSSQDNAQLMLASIESELSSIELEDHWVVWPHDANYRERLLPEIERLNKPTLDALGDLRGILGVEGTPIRIAMPPTATKLTPSGATDEGDLIQTAALRELLNPNNSISYIFGRKGTGKTRLLWKLSDDNLGEPLLVDSSSKVAFGLRSPSPLLSKAASMYTQNPEMLWWQMLSAALDITTTRTNDFTAAFDRVISTSHSSDSDIFENVMKKLSASGPRTFLLDGLETAFQPKHVFSFMQGLFKFLQSIESDPSWGQRIRFKLFLRTDLAQRGYQNLEQQTSGRVMNLSWDTQSILNFVLSRLTKLSWFRDHFPGVLQEISDNYNRVILGALPIDECFRILLKVFPETLRRNNLSTKTFLKTYFADSAGDRLTYYPRIYDKFLEVLANPGKSEDPPFVGAVLESGKIGQSLIFFAHDAAAREYLNQLRSELIYLIELSDNFDENVAKVASLLGAFSGLSTPFNYDDRVAELSSLTSIEKTSVRTAMDRMKNLGMFEDRPGYPGQWRVGRLFKSSLRMKYVR